MNWKQFYFSFEGRVNRRDFWVKFIVPFCIPSIVVWSLHDTKKISDAVILMALLFLAWPSLAVQIKRWHDRNKSGWWILIGLIPAVGPFWVLIETWFLPGTIGKNKYDSDKS